MNLFLKLFIFFFIGFSFITLPSFTQDTVLPYTAEAYFYEEQHSGYQAVLGKIKREETLSKNEIKFYKDYNAYLIIYLNNLSDEEKIRYEEYKVQWEDELTDKKEEQDSDVLETTRLGIKPGRKYLLSNGIYGFGYGLAGAFILDVDESWAIALPFLSAGIAMAYPFLNPKKYEGITYSTVMLSRHGKFIGILDGAALGFLLFGDPDDNDWAGKAIMATTVAGSIAMGEIGFQYGKKHDLPEGKVATYKYYSILGPWLAFAGLVAANVDDPRIYGGAILGAGALSYVYANHVYNKYKFSRGDRLAASSFGLLSTALGFGLTPIDDPKQLLVPAATSLVGTLSANKILKNAKFTSKQGWNINYATGIGTLIGLGAAIIINPESHYVMLILPAATGLVGWGILTNKYKKQIYTADRKKKKRWSSLSVNLTPQNYFLNKQIRPSIENPRQSGLPMFSLQLNL